VSDDPYLSPLARILHVLYAFSFLYVKRGRCDLVWFGLTTAQEGTASATTTPLVETVTVTASDHTSTTFATSVLASV
jgi:hypothetical protein